MFQVIILVCSLDLAPSECQIENALDVVRGPVVANEIMCGLHGQAFIAQTTVAPRDDSEYLKLRCTPLATAEEALQRRANVELKSRHFQPRHETHK